MKGSAMKQILLMVFSLLMFAPSVARAEEYATMDDAKILAERAAALVKEAGRDAALPKLNDPKGDYIFRDLMSFSSAMTV
jgi:hypothetical protein